MKRIATFAAYLCFLMTLSPVIANADPIEVGLFTQNSFRTCGSPDRCFQGDRIIDFVSDFDIGGDGDDGSVSTQQFDPGNLAVQGASSAGFQGAGFTPALSSYAFSGEQTRFTVAALAIQQYVFESAGTLTIDGALTYSQSGETGPTNENPRGIVAGGFVSFGMDGDILDPFNCNFFENDITRNNASGTFLSCILRNGAPNASLPSGFIEFDGLNSVQNTEFGIGTGAISDGLATASHSIAGNAGDVFYLGAYISSFAHLGGFADSRNTLLLELDDPTLVTASFDQESFSKAPLTVPEPGTFILLLIGLLTAASSRYTRCKIITNNA